MNVIDPNQIRSLDVGRTVLALIGLTAIWVLVSESILHAWRRLRRPNRSRVTPPRE